MAGTTSRTRKFLMGQPRPMKLRVHVPGEDKPRILPLAPGQSWQKFADTVDALSPRLIEALDVDGNLIRALNTETPEEEEEEEVIPEDPTVALEGDGPLETFARLLADAHRSSGEKAFQFVETAFAQMVNIVNGMNARQASMERTVASYERLVASHAFNGAGGADGEEGGPAAGGNALLMQMMAQFLAGGMGAAAPKGTNGVNGAGHVPKGGDT